MNDHNVPGIYRATQAPPATVRLRTGVPAFLGYAGGDEAANTPVALTPWADFLRRFPPVAGGYLATAVRGFFENGGELGYVVRLEAGLSPVEALNQGLAALAPLDELDLVCAPDIMQPDSAGGVGAEPVRAMQAAVLNHCAVCGDRLALLDSLPGADGEAVLAQRNGLAGINGALYYPWLRVAEGPMPPGRPVPPCGHVAGVIARTDREAGVHRAPANALVESVLDLERPIDASQQAGLNPNGVNCLRAFPGRGIRVWGARTLSRESAWIYINVRRLFLTAGRWIERALRPAVLEPNDVRLWVRVERELTAYFTGLFQRGALMGRTPEEAFFVKCDAETNPQESQDLGRVIAEIGLAPAVPGEFVIVQLSYGESGVNLSGPTQPV